MKTVRISNGIVAEIIPEAAAIPSVSHWYGGAFAAACVEAPDEVEQGWIYNPVAGTFVPPPAETEPPLDELTQLRLALAELAEAQEADQTATELALAELADIMTGGAT
jgi:hypothetical protein